MTSIADMNHAYNLALTSLREKLDAQKHETDQKIDAHLSEFRHDFTPIDNKVWAVKDARLSERMLCLLEMTQMIDKEMKQ